MSNYRKSEDKHNCKTCSHSRVIGVFSAGFDYQCYVDNKTHVNVSADYVCDEHPEIKETHGRP